MDKPKIVVIEDEIDLLHAYSRALRQSGFDVLEAATGADGLRVCIEQNPDLVFLDVVLPDMDGGEICQRIKDEQRARTIFVVMISGQRLSPDEQAFYLECGADSFLQKPINLKVLLANARAMLRLKEAEDALAESREQYRQLAEQLREKNLQLEEYNRLKAEFIANMSHELRTPLTAIIGFAQLAQMKDADALTPSVKNALERIWRNARHLLALIDEILDISKLEAGRLTIHPEHFDLAELAQEVFDELQSLAAQKNLDYRLKITDHFPYAFNDPERIRQVMTNLLSNAIKFTERGAVEVRLEAGAHETFRFAVRDTGIGIALEAQKYIFERFRQVDGTPTRAAGGTGLGLSIVKQIVELLGGTVEVFSEPGKGSDFIVTLPLSLSEAKQAAGKAETEREAEKSAAFADALDQAVAASPNIGTPLEGETEAERFKPLVLIIEDDADAGRILSDAVERAGYRARYVESGAQGLQLARASQPAAILLDVMMPGMDGWKVLQKLKSEPRTAQIPVLVCSIVDNRPLGYRLGASAYFVKPVEPRQLTETLREIIPNGHESTGSYVLVVDDEHGVRELLAKALRKASYRVRTAASGEIALQMTRRRVPQAVLTDLIMPGGMSGFELIARLRAFEATENVPIIVITGKDLTSEDKQFIRDQIADVIRKGELLLSDLDVRLRQTLEEVGVAPNE